MDKDGAELRKSSMEHHFFEFTFPHKWGRIGVVFGVLLFIVAGFTFLFSLSIPDVIQTDDAVRINTSSEFETSEFVEQTLGKGFDGQTGAYFTTVATIESGTMIERYCTTNDEGETQYHAIVADSKIPFSIGGSSFTGTWYTHNLNPEYSVGDSCDDDVEQGESHLVAVRAALHAVDPFLTTFGDERIDGFVQPSHRGVVRKVIGYRDPLRDDHPRRGSSSEELERLLDGAVDLPGAFASNVRAEESLGDDSQREVVEIFVTVADRTRAPLVFEQLRPGACHGRRVGVHRGCAERRVGEPALPRPRLAVADEQTLTRERRPGEERGALLDEEPRAIDHDVRGHLRVGDEHHALTREG